MAARCAPARDRQRARAARTRCPSAIEVDISSLVDFEATLHVSDIVAPAGVTILTDGRRAAGPGPGAARRREPVVAAGRPTCRRQRPRPPRLAARRGGSASPAYDERPADGRGPASLARAPCQAAQAALGELVADLGQQLDLGRTGRRGLFLLACGRARRLIGFTTKKKIADRDDDEVDERVEEHAEHQDAGGSDADGDLQVEKSGQAQDAQQRRDDVGHEGCDDRAECRADDDRDRECTTLPRNRKSRNSLTMILLLVRLGAPPRAAPDPP